MSIQTRLQDLCIELPPASNPAANYTNCVLSGNRLFVSGKGPVSGLTEVPRGKLGSDYTTEQGYAFARQTGLDILAVVQLYLGSLDRISRVVKIQGFVNATADFEEHPKVLNGCSDLLVEIFGEKGIHARSVFGAVSVRGNLPIIIDSIFEVDG